MTPAAAPLLTTVKGMKGVGTVLRNRITGTSALRKTPAVSAAHREELCRPS